MISTGNDSVRHDHAQDRNPDQHQRASPAEARLTEKHWATSNATSDKLEALEDTSSGEMLSTAFREQPAFPDTS
jgi:hypothetical protein